MCPIASILVLRGCQAIKVADEQRWLDQKLLERTAGYVEQAGTRSCRASRSAALTSQLSEQQHCSTTSFTGGEQAVADSRGFLSFYSGGGFRNIFERPSWQDPAVSDYLDKTSSSYTESAFNRSGCGFSEVA